MALIRKLGAFGLLTAAAVGGFVACEREMANDGTAPGATTPSAFGDPSVPTVADRPRLVDTQRARIFSAQTKADRAAQNEARAKIQSTVEAGVANWTVTTGSSVVGAPAVYGASFTSESSADQMFFGVSGNATGSGITSSLTNCTSTLCNNANFFALTNIYASAPSLSWGTKLTNGTSADVALNATGTEVYVFDDGGHLYCFNAAAGAGNAAVKCTGWTANPAATTVTITGVAITPWVDSYLNAIYINDGAGAVYKYNATTGAQIWKYTYATGKGARSWPVEADNCIYVGNSAGILYRIVDNGTSTDAGTVPTSSTSVTLTATNCTTKAAINGSISLDSSAGLIFIPNGQCLFTLNHSPNGAVAMALQGSVATYSLPENPLQTWPTLDGTYAYWVIPQVPTSDTPISSVWKASYDLSSVSGAALQNASASAGGATLTAAPLLYDPADYGAGVGSDIYVGDTSGYVERFGCASSSFSTTSFIGETSAAPSQINTPIVLDNAAGNIEYGYNTGVAQFQLNMGAAADGGFAWDCPTGQVACDNQQCGAGASKTGCVPTAECASSTTSCIRVSSVTGSSIQCASGTEEVNTPYDTQTQITGGSTGGVICPSGTVIQGVLAASYGTTGEQCPAGKDAGLGFDFGGSCFESSSLATTETYCPLDTATLCGDGGSMRANNATFGNPCPDTNKFYAGWFVCAPKADASTYVFCSRQNVVAWESDGGLGTGGSDNDPCNTTTGKCTGTCFSGWGDCNNNLQYDGCETYTGGTDSSNCGSCGNVCTTPTNASAVSCVSGTCTPTCNSGYVACGSSCCAECTSAFTETGYTVSNCGADTASGTSCSAVCASGYAGTAVGPVSCTTAGTYSGTFTGCTKECTAFTETGYTVSNCSNPTSEGTSCSATCATGYSGTVSGSVSCSTGGAYSGTFTGCTKECTAFTETGYTVSNCGANTKEGTVCSATCNTGSGYYGTVSGTVFCSTGGSYSSTFSGCGDATCAAYSQTGYTMRNCDTTGTASGTVCTVRRCSVSGTPGGGPETCENGSYVGTPFTGCAP